jgi:hypothetical protein
MHATAAKQLKARFVISRMVVVKLISNGNSSDRRDQNHRFVARAEDPSVTDRGSRIGACHNANSTA